MRINARSGKNLIPTYVTLRSFNVSSPLTSLIDINHRAIGSYLASNHGISDLLDVTITSLYCAIRRLLVCLRSEQTRCRSRIFNIQDSPRVGKTRYSFLESAAPSASSLSLPPPPSPGPSVPVCIICYLSHFRSPVWES